MYSRNARLIGQAVKDLHHKNWKKRRRAMRLLVDKGEKSIPSLIPLLESESMTIRATAAEALEHIGADAVPALLEVLAEGGEVARRHAAGTLGQIRDDRAAAALIAALGDDDTRLRRAAAMALGSLRSGEAVSALVEVLEDEDPAVRGYASEALGRIARESPGVVEPAVPGLAGRLKDAATFLSTRRRVCDAAADALRAVGTSEALDAVATWEAA